MNEYTELDIVDAALRRCKAHAAVLLERGGPYDQERLWKALSSLENTLLDSLARTTSYDGRGQAEL